MTIVGGSYSRGCVVVLLDSYCVDTGRHSGRRDWEGRSVIHGELG